MEEWKNGGMEEWKNGIVEWNCEATQVQSQKFKVPSLRGTADHESGILYKCL
jgi:hypothetical protein